MLITVMNNFSYGSYSIYELFQLHDDYASQDPLGVKEQQSYAAAKT